MKQRVNRKRLLAYAGGNTNRHMFRLRGKRWVVALVGWRYWNM